MSKKFKFIPVFLLILLLLGCTTAETDDPAPEATAEVNDEEPATLTLMSHDSFAISEALLESFEEEHNVIIELLPAGDTGSALNQAILTKEDPLADIFFGLDNTFMSRALEADIFEPYESPALAGVPAEFQLDETNRLTPIDYGDVCLNYDKAWFAEHGLEPPQRLADLTDPAYEGLTVVENPVTSSPGLAFLLATIDQFGQEGEYNYETFWADLRANDLWVSDGWEDAYWGQFSGASDGERPIVVSYASSPPAEVVFADPPIDEPPTAAVTAPGTCFRQIEFAGILQGTAQPVLAQAFIDFMLSQPFQEDIPLNMFVFPVNPDAELPDVFVQWAEVAEQPAQLSPAEIEANRETWLEQWTEIVLR